MEILKNVILAFHIIGIASLLGGMLVQMKSMKTGETKIVPAIMHGAWTMLITGLALVGMAYALGNGEFVNNAKIGAKTVVLLAIFVIAFMNKKKPTLAGWVLPSLMVLTLANIFMATVWKAYN